MSARSLYSVITDNNIDEEDNNVAFNAPWKLVNASNFIEEQAIQPTPPEDTQKWKQTYLNEAASLWKPSQEIKRSGPGSLKDRIISYKVSEKILIDKGQGKF